MSYDKKMSNSHFQKCFLSELGHRNFWYPTAVEALLSPDCTAESLPWVCGSQRNLKPLKVHTQCVLPLSGTPPTGEIITAPKQDSYVVVWVEK